MAVLKDSLITGDLRVTGTIYGDVPLDDLVDAKDLKAIEALSGSGIPVRTGNNTWTINASVPPSAHAHGNLTSDGKVGADANKAIYTGTGGAIQAGTLPVAGGGTGQTTFTSGELLMGNGANGLSTIVKTSANTANTVVLRDASGNFTAGTITAASFVGTGTGKATNSTTAPIKSAGGLAVAKNIWVGASSGESTTSNTSSQLIVSSNDTGSGGNVALELWRGTNASWQISNESGNLHFRTNWTTAKQNTYSFNAIEVAYNTGRVTLNTALPVTSGGTGVATLPANKVLLGNGTTAIKTGNINYTEAAGSKSGTKYMLRIWGPAEGNTAANLVSQTAGVLRFNDPGPQIQFSPSETGGQQGALIFTDHDSAGNGVSWHFVSSEGDNNNGGEATVTAPRFRARAGLTVGQNSDDTSYTFKVNGTSQLNGNATVTGQLRTSFKSSVAMGTYQAAANTIPNLCEELRYSSGVAGSASITTAYTKDSVTIGTGWYNFLWIPHRDGGLNGAANGDNCNYGSLYLSGMTVSGAYMIRYSSQAIAEVRNLYKPIIANHSYTPAGSVSVSTNGTTNKTAPVSPASSGTVTYTPAGTIAVNTAGSTVAADDITAWTTNTPTAVTKKTVVVSATVSNEVLTISTGDSVSVTAGTAASLSYTARTVKSGDASYKFTGTGVRLVTGNIAVPNTYTASFSGTAATLSHTVS